jgi:hypothetical protein
MPGRSESLNCFWPQLRGFHLYGIKTLLFGASDVQANVAQILDVSEYTLD